MRCSILFIPLCVLLLSSCNNRSHVWEQPPAEEVYEESEDEGPIIFDYSATELTHDFAYSTWHVFSDADAKDKFTFYVPDGNINDTKTILTIETAESDTVFSDTLLTVFLIDDGDLVTIVSDAEMAKYIEAQAQKVLGNVPFIDADGEEIADWLARGRNIDDTATLSELVHDGRPIFRLTMLGNTKAYFGYSAVTGSVNLICSR